MAVERGRAARRTYASGEESFGGFVPGGTAALRQSVRVSTVKFAEHCWHLHTRSLSVTFHDRTSARWQMGQRISGHIAQR